MKTKIIYNFNISNNKSLIDRDLLMSEELIRFKFGEALFMTTRMYLIHARIKPISEYPIKIEMAKLPNEKKEFDVKCLDLNKFKKEKLSEEYITNKVKVLENNQDINKYFKENDKPFSFDNIFDYII